MSSGVAISQEKKKKASVSAASSEQIVAKETKSGARAGLPIFLQAKLNLGPASDEYEKEADRVSEIVVNSGSAPVIQRKCEACASGGSCPKCEEEEENRNLVQRKTSDTATVPSLGVVPEDTAYFGAGEALEPNTRAFMESSFGYDFGDVRIHTDRSTENAAQALGALAFTAESDVGFAPGHFAPHTQSGRKLLAHELTHVVQQRQNPSPTVRRQLAGQLNISMTPDYARGLSDAELTEQISALENYLSTMPQDGADRDPIASNLQILRAERVRRGALASELEKQAIGEAPRPAGLPNDQAYALQPAPENLQALADLLPEGQLVNLAAAPDTGSAQPSRLASPLAGAAQATSISSNAMFASQAFAAAGQDSILIVAIPRWFTPGATIPESASPWGHTAVGVRIGGIVRAVRGFSPASTADVAANYSAVRSGARAVPAEITNDIGLLTKAGAVTMEYPVAAEVAEALLQQLPPVGPVAASGPRYTGVPAAFGDACRGQNCVWWATQLAEKALGGRIGPAGGPPITDVPQVGQASQGRLVRFIRNASQGTEDVASVEQGIGPAVASGMPTGLKILKVGGRVMIVFSLAMIPIETYLAPPEQRERTFVGATGGFIGGFGTGAAAGLVCGPGFLVCSIVLGLGFGIAGSIAGRNIAEGAYDLAVDVGSMTPAQWIDTTTLMFGTPEQRRANCELKEIEGIDDPLCNF